MRLRILILLLAMVLPCAAQYGSGTGSYGTIGKSSGGNAATATVATNLATIEPTMFYVSPSLGNDANSGRNRSVPFKTYINAANTAYSNAPATIVLMAGTYIFPGTNGTFNDYFIVPPFVNVIGEPSNQVVVTFTNTTGVLQNPDMQPCGTNQITGVNFTFNSGGSSDVPLGNFNGSANLLPVNYAGISFTGTSMLAVFFTDCTFAFQGTGIHFEGASSALVFNWDFNRCRFLCNNNWIQLREGGPLITVENSDVTMLNWTNVPVVNAKPFRILESRTLPNVFSNNFPVRIKNTQFHCYDTELSNSNRPFFFCWNTLATTNTFVATNIFQLSSCDVDEVLTNPTSMDLPPFAFNTSTQCVVTVNNVIRRDNGGALTLAPGYSVRTLTDYTLPVGPINFIGNPIVSGGYWTNTNSFSGTLVINLSLLDAISGDPGMNITNISTGEWMNATSSLAVAGLIPATAVFRMAPNNVLVATNFSSGSATATINSSSFRQ